MTETAFYEIIDFEEAVDNVIVHIEEMLSEISRKSMVEAATMQDGLLDLLILARKLLPEETCQDS
jgi:hypothetical protein